LTLRNQSPVIGYVISGVLLLVIIWAIWKSKSDKITFKLQDSIEDSSKAQK